MFRSAATSLALAACGLIAGCDNAQTAPAAAEPVAAPEVAAPAVPVATLGSEIALMMTCAALSSSEGITRDVTLTGGNGAYTYLEGAKDSKRYELWEMKIDAANAFTVTGEYIEGGPTLKQLSFTGTVTGATVSGEGKRGPRKCTIKT